VVTWVVVGEMEGEGAGEVEEVLEVTCEEEEVVVVGVSMAPSELECGVCMTGYCSDMSTFLVVEVVVEEVDSSLAMLLGDLPKLSSQAKIRLENFDVIWLPLHLLYCFLGSSPLRWQYRIWFLQSTICWLLSAAATCARCPQCS
jgi:hypothetical protein